MMCQTGLPISCLIFPQCDLHKGWFFWFGNRSFASLCFWNGPHVDSSKVYRSCLNERRATASNFQRNIYHRLRAASTFSPQIVFHLHHSRTLCVKTQILPFPKTWTMTRTTRGAIMKILTMMLMRGSVGLDKRSKACPVWPVPSGCAAGTRLPITIYILDPTTPFSHSCAWPHFYMSNSFLTTLS